MMSIANESLKELQGHIDQSANANEAPEFQQKLYFVEIQNQVHVEFYGTPFDESYELLLETLCAPNVANEARSISLRGPDEGSNGTRNWNLARLTESSTVFPILATFYVEPTAPEHHNQTIIGADYNEEGQIGKLISKAPALQSLTVPSAPDASFFQRTAHPLRVLRVDTGYAHQNFVLNFATSDCFPELTWLDFGDYNQRYTENYENECTPFDHYEQLFLSTAFAPVKTFLLRNSILSKEQLTHLRLMRKDVAIYLIQEQGAYFR